MVFVGLERAVREVLGFGGERAVAVLALANQLVVVELGLDPRKSVISSLPPSAISSCSGLPFW
jgi:hypothetical protein